MAIRQLVEQIEKWVLANGDVTEVRVRYTQFDPTGKPTRAVLELRAG